MSSIYNAGKGSVENDIEKTIKNSCILEVLLYSYMTKKTSHGCVPRGTMSFIYITEKVCKNSNTA
jgi:hypothetical protein